MEEIRRRLGFAKGFTVERVGLARGIAIWWNEEVTLSVLSYSRSHVDCVVEEGVEYRLSVFYGNPITHRRCESWDLLKSLSEARDGPWLDLRDFNETLFGWESNGRRQRREWQMRSFREAVEACGISDLCYRGLSFTYSNKREGVYETRARLDRATEIYVDI
ncbi:hypothetical protein QQ045_004111 [Rhodiola kirilowii]